MKVPLVFRREWPSFKAFDVLALDGKGSREFADALEIALRAANSKTLHAR